MSSERVVQKFVNSAETAVGDALLGLTLTNSEIGVLEGTHTVVLRKPNPNKVHLLCGGGSGHEPAHAGYLSEEGLSAAVCGGVFASPPTKHIIKAIEHLNHGSGVLVIIKNYTGDIINFESAVQSCSLRGIKVKSLVVNDDIAFIQTDKDRKDARGLCGTVLLYKILGAAAALGWPLDKLREFGASIIARTSTLNASLGACALPGRPAGFHLQQDYYQLGLGIHGEKGRQVRKIGPCKEIIHTMVERFAFAVAPSIEKHIVVVLNNLGGCSELEMAILTGQVCTAFGKMYTVERIVVGNLMTSLEMHGMSITLLLLDNIEEELKLVDSASRTRGWWPQKPTFNPLPIPTAESAKSKVLLDKEAQPSPTHHMLTTLAAFLSSKVSQLNDLDREVGDGDTGESIQRSLCYISTHNTLNRLDASQQFSQSLAYLGEVIANESAGSLGTILGRFLEAVGSKLHPKPKDNDQKTWAEAFKFGINVVKAIGKCELGDRTVLDVLVPISDTLSGEEVQVGSLLVAKLADRCKLQCQNVTKLQAKKGRTRYLNGKQIGQADPGCQFIQFILEGILKGLQNE